MLGERLPDRCHYGYGDDDVEVAGAYWRCLDRDGHHVVVDDEPTNLTGACWMVVTPNGLIGHLAMHTVREHDDRTISVRPGDGSSNSILVQAGDLGSWHGYIEHGVWSEC